MLLNVAEPIAINSLGTIGLSQLASVFPLPIVKEALEQFERYTCRLRELPNEMMFYFPMMMALDRDDSASETLRRVLEGNLNVFGRRTEKITGKAGISKARMRVGSEPLKLVFDSLCKPLAKEKSAYTHFDGLRIVAVDGVLVNLPDTQQNSDYFGRPSNQHATAASYPQARVVGLVECGTHAIIGANIGRYTDSEITLAKDVLLRVDSDMLVIADRLYLGWQLFNQVHENGAKILWRIKAREMERFEVVDRLADGSYTAMYRAPDDFVKKSPKGMIHEPIPVRVCSYRLECEKSEDVHLVTTLLDWEKAPLTRLAELYMQRWEIVLVFKEMKVELNKNEAAIRSATTDLAKQELYGLMMTHYAIRSVIHEAAARAKLDPDRISFRATVRAIRRKSLKGGSFSP